MRAGLELWHAGQEALWHVPDDDGRGGPVRVLTTGSQSWPAPDVVHDTLLEVWHDVVQAYGCDRRWLVVNGMADEGADALVVEWCRDNGIEVEEHPADWDRHPRQGGMIRNQEMVDCGAHVCVAFIDRDSPGSTATAEAAAKAGIPVWVRRWPEQVPP